MNFKNLQFSDVIKVGGIISTFVIAFYVLQNNFTNHENNKDIHYTVNELSRVFVPRSEYDIMYVQLKDELKEVKVILTKVNDKIDNIILVDKQK